MTPSPSPYGRPPRDPAPFRVDRRKVADTVPERRRPAPKPVASDAALDFEVLQIFAWGRYPDFLSAFEGFRPRWAVAAFGRCLERGLLAESDVTYEVRVTAGGWAELEPWRGQV